MKNNKTGLLYLGERSTNFYLDQFAARGESPLLIKNLDFEKLNNHLPNQFPILEEILRPCLQSDDLLEVDWLLIPNVTLHETYDRLLVRGCGFEFHCVHPVQVTLDCLKQKGYSKAVLFASSYSMRSASLASQFHKEGVELIVPEVGDAKFIDEVRQLVYAQKESPKEIKEFNQLVSKCTQRAPVVIACTELSIALDDLLPDVYDMVRLQINSVLM